eukprot:257126-Rhodomonas_salina.1
MTPARPPLPARGGPERARGPGAANGDQDRTDKPAPPHRPRFRAEQSEAPATCLTTSESLRFPRPGVSLSASGSGQTHCQTRRHVTRFEFASDCGGRRSVKDSVRAHREDVHAES